MALCFVLFSGRNNYPPSSMISISYCNNSAGLFNTPGNEASLGLALGSFSVLLGRQSGVKNK